MKKILIINFALLLVCLNIKGQAVQQDLKREVTLYNPYKPSLPDFRKRSILPAIIDDTAKTRPDFKYVISTRPYFPEYTISPIKAATLQPDPLDKLYKSYINLGLGNYLTPLAELSITNERSKKGAIGFYARHFSSNGKVKLQNDKSVPAGFMDNDVSLFGKKFFRENQLEGSIDFSQKVRHAYGYDTSITDYDPVSKEILMGYNNLGTQLSFSSLTLDSTSFSYDFGVDYHFFYNARSRYQHSASIKARMASTYRDFYIGSGLGFEFFKPSETIYNGSKYVASLSPFVRKSTSQWNFNIGFQLLLDRNMTDKPDFHIYPDLSFGFSIVPSYISFIAAINGNLEQNTPQNIIPDNPFIVRDGTLFRLKNTDKKLAVSAGLKGNTGIGGNYLISASYSVIDDFLFYTNYIFPGDLITPERGNHFIPIYDNVELLNIHGELSGKISDKLNYNGKANYFKYTLMENDYAWGKPSWDGSLGLKYNLRNKVIAGLDMNVSGERRLMASVINELPPATSIIFHMPVFANFNISTEYRYTKILSFWFKLNNISFNRYYEWAYYPTRRFIGMIGFSYSL